MISKIVSSIASILFIIFSSIPGASACAPASNVTKYTTFGTIEPKICEDCADGAILDDMGYEWYYYDRLDLYEGERIVVVFHDNGTPDYLCDDVILEILPADC